MTWWCLCIWHDTGTTSENLAQPSGWHISPKVGQLVSWEQRSRICSCINCLRLEPPTWNCLLWYEFSSGPFFGALLRKLLRLLTDFVSCALVSLEGSRENRKEDWKAYYIHAPSTYSTEIGIANFNSQEYSCQNLRFWEGFFITKDQLFGSSISVPFRSCTISEFVVLMV